MITNRSSTNYRTAITTAAAAAKLMRVRMLIKLLLYKDFLSLVGVSDFYWWMIIDYYYYYLLQ